MKRRALLQGVLAGLAGPPEWLDALGRAAVTPSAALKSAHPSTESYRAPDWLRYCRPIYFEGYASPVFPHLRDFDARHIVELALELGGDTLRFQPIGYQAVYPSKVFPVHPELGNRDLIDEVSRECRRTGMHLYCYCVLSNGMEERWIDDPRYSVYVLRDADGKPYGRDTGLGNAVEYKTCATGEPYRTMIRQLVSELCAHDIDGVYFDSPSGYRGICHCESCRAGFEKFSGMDLGRLRNIRDLEDLPDNADLKALSAWYDWANTLVKEDLEDLGRIIHGSGKFMLCHNGATWRPGSFHLQYRYADGFMVEYSDEFYQRLFHALLGASMARPGRKVAQMYMGGYDVAAIGHPPHNRPWTPHFLNLEDGDEILMEGFADLAGGNVPLYGVLNRLLYGIGEGSTKPAKEVFGLMRRAESILKDSLPAPYVTIIPTAESLELFRTGRRGFNVMMSEAFGLLMLDERISFDVVPNLEISREWLKGQRVIVLCGASGITDQDARLLTDWVKEGGSLLATYDSGLYNDKGRLRGDGGALRDVLGVEMAAEPPDGQTDTYYRILTAHPALGGYPAGKIVMGDARLVPVRVRPGAAVLADCLNLETQENRGPAIVLNRCGLGRAIYVAGSLEANYLASRVRTLQRMLGSMVRFLAGSAPLPFRLTAPKGVYGILRRAPGGDPVLWICANVGFKDAAVGRMRQDYVTVSNVVAKILVPDGRVVDSVELLRAGQVATFTMEGPYAVVLLPTLHIAEVVHVRLAPIATAKLVNR